MNSSPVARTIRHTANSGEARTASIIWPLGLSWDEADERGRRCGLAAAPLEKPANCAVRGRPCIRREAGRTGSKVFVRIRRKTSISVYGRRRCSPLNEVVVFDRANSLIETVGKLCWSTCAAATSRGAPLFSVDSGQASSRSGTRARQSRMLVEPLNRWQSGDFEKPSSKSDEALQP